MCIRDRLYTDFPNEENRADAFLEDVDFSSISYDDLRIPLPIDCAGKTLRIVTYGTALNGLLYPAFPSLVSRFSDSVTAVSSIVWPMAAITAQVILALFLLLVDVYKRQGVAKAGGGIVQPVKLIAIAIGHSAFLTIAI